MKFMFKGGTSTYALIDLVVLDGIDFENREKSEVLDTLGADFEYDLALKAKNFVIPDNFIKVPQNTILTETSSYYVTVNYNETSIKKNGSRGIAYYTGGRLVKKLPKTMRVLLPSWGITPVSRDIDVINDIDKVKLQRLLGRINIQKFDISSLEFFSACVWGNNVVVQDRERCYVVNLRNKRKIQELDGFKLLGALNGRPILNCNQTGQDVLLELDKYLELIKF